MRLSKILERPVVSNPMDILCNTILEAVEDHSAGKQYRKELNDPYYTALACQSQQSMSISYASVKGLERDALNG
jgi:hypothetical protein